VRSKKLLQQIKTTFGIKKILDHLLKKHFFYFNIGHLLLHSSLNVGRQTEMFHCRGDCMHIWINGRWTRNAYDFESLRAECQQAVGPASSDFYHILHRMLKLQISVDVGFWWRSWRRLQLSEMPDRWVNYFNISPSCSRKVLKFKSSRLL